MGLLGTMLLGIIGSFLGGTLWGVLTGSGFALQRTDTFFGAVIGSIIALLIYRAVAGRRRA
ncbi:MAG: GlsB/YeaQ/YmgE family stress response membrane protein [Nitriliruptorales bacterium]|nr:GlsB/YeaQ/YmgE family stress response membrane protein [Nitriliruptorales bacterium]